MQPPQLVLNHYVLPLTGLHWERVGGGFSGAEVWRGDDAEGPCYALKAWPLGFPPARLELIHRWMGLANHLAFVPTVLVAADGRKFVDTGERLWDATTWMPGSPREEPTIDEIETASATIADLHAAWKDESLHEPAPGVRNRLRLLREWLSAPSDSSSAGTPLSRGLLDRAATVLARAAPRALKELEAWENVSFRCQPCLRDVRGEHVLFVDGRVTGVVDYGAMAIDHPAVDLARLLGDYAGRWDDVVAAGWRAYRSAGGEKETSREFVAQLAVGGALGSVINWLRRLQNGRALPVGLAAIESRLDGILRRIERFAPA